MSPTQIGRTFDNLAVYNIGYVTVDNVSDGPVTKSDAIAILAESPEQAIIVVRQILAPLVPTIMQVQLGLEGKNLHYAPSYLN